MFKINRIDLQPLLFSFPVQPLQPVQCHSELVQPCILSKFHQINVDQTELLFHSPMTTRRFSPRCFLVRVPVAYMFVFLFAQQSPYDASRVMHDDRCLERRWNPARLLCWVQYDRTSKAGVDTPAVACEIWEGCSEILRLERSRTKQEMSDVKTVADAAADKLLSIYAQTESDGYVVAAYQSPTYMQDAHATQLPVKR